MSSGEFIGIFYRVADNCSRWFTSLMDASQMGDLYIACIFISLACGFLLSNFGVGFRIGSDKAASHFKKRRDD